MTPLILLVLVCLVSALPGRFNLKDVAASDHEYRAALATDSRSPCPMLNALANHGYFPRNGRNINEAMAWDVFRNVMKIDWVASKILLGQALPLGTVVEGVKQFDLGDLAKHNKIEADASLARADYDVTGDVVTFNQTIFNDIYKFVETDENGKTYITTQGLMKFRHLRERKCKEEHPSTFFLDDSLRRIQHLQVAILSLEFEDSRGRIYMDLMETLFREEKLPENWWFKPASAYQMFWKRLNALNKIFQELSNE